MKAIVTGCNGLVGLATTRRLLAMGYEVIGVDDDSRGRWFGAGGSTSSHRISHPRFTFFGQSVADFALHVIAPCDVIVHAAAQPSHELANTNPAEDFGANVSTTCNILEWYRRYSPDAVFIHLSTTKVYGDSLNNWGITEAENRYKCEQLITEETAYSGAHGIFGADKLAADVIAQEYGKEYGLKVVVFRPGCITGKDHAGVRAHGFLSYLGRCIKNQEEYIVNGYGGLQVRDQLHVEDLVDAFLEVIQSPPDPGEVFVIGGGLGNSISVLEAIARFEELAGKKAVIRFGEARKADHKWNVHDNSKFMQHYPNWQIKYDLGMIFTDILNAE